MSRKKNFAEKQAARLTKARKATEDFITAQQNLGIALGGEDVDEQGDA